jgi:hypothetical protein
MVNILFLSDIFSDIDVHNHHIFLNKAFDKLIAYAMYYDMLMDMNDHIPNELHISDHIHPKVV